MKRIVCLMMVCGLVLGALPAYAEGPVRTMLNINSNEFAWFRENGINYQNFEDGCDHTTQRVLDMLQGEDAMDIVLFDTMYCDFDVLMQSGLLEDLSSNLTICERTQAMHEPIRKKITMENGQIMGAFRELRSAVLTRVAPAWEQAGLTDTDAPHSLTELLDFIEQRWIPLVREKKVGNVRLNTTVRIYDVEFKYQYTGWLLELLMTCWELRKQAAGESVVYDEPEFVALAERCREVGLTLAKVEKKPGKKSRSLYQGEFNFDDTNAYIYALPMRINADEPERLMTYAQVFAVRKGSPYSEILKEFLAAMVTMDRGTWPSYSMNPELYSDVPIGQFVKPHDSNRNRGFIQSALWHDTYHPEWQLFWKIPGGAANNYSGAKESLRYQFAHGEITAHEFAQKLDEKIGSDKK